MVAFVSTALFADPFGVKAVLRGFRVKQNGIVLARVSFAGAPARLVMPDDLIFEAWAAGTGAEPKNFVQQHFGVMCDAPVQVNVEAASGSQQTVKQDKSFV